MTRLESPAGHPVKRTDVGYKRPPAEHQFKKGQKPPQRKPKSEAPDLSPTEILWQILREQRRVSLNGKAVWMSNAELIMRKAVDLAEGGNPTMQRAVNGLLFALDDGKPPLNGRVRLELDGVHAGWLPSNKGFNGDY